MAEVHGKLGALYYSRGYIKATTIAFVDSNPDTITDSGSGFVTAGFTATDKITVVGSTSNDGTYTIANVAAGTLTLDAGDTLVAEVAGDDVTIDQADPGTQLAGFFDWSLDLGADVAEVTDFGDAGIKAFIAGGSGWTGAARKHWMSEGNQDAWIGNTYTIRFFAKYVAVPSGGDKAYFYQGRAIVNGIATTEAHDTVVEQALTFQGIGAIALQTQQAAWP